MTKKIILIIGILVVVGIAVMLILGARQEGQVDGTGGFSIKNFFPFGNPEVDFVDVNATNEPVDSIEGENASSGEVSNMGNEVNIPKLRKISTEPVAGSIFLQSGTTSILRFVYKSSGNVYEVHSNRANVVRLTNTTIPKINRVIWLPDGSGFLTQRADESGFTQTNFVRLRPRIATTSELTTAFEPVISELPSGIIEITPSPDSKKIFFYTMNGNAQGFVSDPDGTNQTLVFSSPFSEWLPNWYSANSILLASKPGFNSNSYGYVLNPTTKTINKYFGGVVGGSALPQPTSANAIISSGGTLPSLWLYTDSTKALSNTLVATLADKCAWVNGELSVICGVPKSTPNSSYPDLWYQGIISTDDIIEKIDLSKNYLLILSNPKTDSGDETEIDVSNLNVSKDNNYSSFINKKDGALWLLKVGG